MELKSTDHLKVLQRAHEKEPAKVEEPVVPVIEVEHGGSVTVDDVNPSQHSYLLELVDNPIGVHAINPV